MKFLSRWELLKQNRFQRYYSMCYISIVCVCYFILYSIIQFTATSTEEETTEWQVDTINDLLRNSSNCPEYSGVMVAEGPSIFSQLTSYLKNFLLFLLIWIKMFCSAWSYHGPVSERHLREMRKFSKIKRPKLKKNELVEIDKEEDFEKPMSLRQKKYHHIPVSLRRRNLPRPKINCWVMCCNYPDKIMSDLIHVLLYVNSENDVKKIKRYPCMKHYNFRMINGLSTEDIFQLKRIFLNFYDFDAVSCWYRKDLKCLFCWTWFGKKRDFFKEDQKKREGLGKDPKEEEDEGMREKKLLESRFQEIVFGDDISDFSDDDFSDGYNNNNNDNLHEKFITESIPVDGYELFETPPIEYNSLKLAKKEDEVVEEEGEVNSSQEGENENENESEEIEEGGEELMKTPKTIAELSEASEDDVGREEKEFAFLFDEDEFNETVEQKEESIFTMFLKCLKGCCCCCLYCVWKNPINNPLAGMIAVLYFLIRRETNCLLLYLSFIDFKNPFCYLAFLSLVTEIIVLWVYFVIRYRHSLSNPLRLYYSYSLMLENRIMKFTSLSIVVIGLMFSFCIYFFTQYFRDLDSFMDSTNGDLLPDYCSLNESVMVGVFYFGKGFSIQVVIDILFLISTFYNEFCSTVFFGCVSCIELSHRTLGFNSVSTRRLIRQSNKIRRKGLRFPKINVPLTTVLLTDPTYVLEMVTIALLFANNKEEVELFSKVPSLKRYKFGLLASLSNNEILFLKKFFYPFFFEGMGHTNYFLNWMYDIDPPCCCCCCSCLKGCKYCIFDCWRCKRQKSDWRFISEQVKRKNILKRRKRKLRENPQFKGMETSINDEEFGELVDDPEEDEDDVDVDNLISITNI